MQSTLYVPPGGLPPPPYREAYIQGYPGKKINELGWIFTCAFRGTPLPDKERVWRPMSIFRTKSGGWQVRLGRGKAESPRGTSLCNLVALHFIGKPPSPKHRVFPLDGNIAHHVASNLIYLTLAEAVARGLYTYPHTFQKKDRQKETYALMRKMFADGNSIEEIAEAFDYGVRYTRKIISGQMYSHIPGAVPIPRAQTGFDWDAMAEQFKQGVPSETLRRQCGSTMMPANFLSVLRKKAGLSAKPGRPKTCIRIPTSEA